MGDVFIPSNPHDRHLTDVEYMKWEAARDAKKDDFPYVALTAKQKQLLKKSKKELVKVTDKNKPDAYRLRSLVFVKTLSNENGVEIIEIRDRGNNYLEYLNREKSNARRITMRDVIVAIIGAFIASLLGMIFRG